MAINDGARHRLGKVSHGRSNQVMKQKARNLVKSTTEV